MDIQHTQTGSKGVFFVEVDGKRLAAMTYVFSGNDKFIIDHTEVDDTLRGKSVGVQLVDAAATFARENNYRIIPLCPFAKAVFVKKAEKYADVLA